MCPRLFTIGPFTVYSYGLMLGIGFLAGSLLLTQELRRKGIDPGIGSTITLLAIVFGIVGAKLLYLVENLEYFVKDPLGTAFSPGGLTFYGGFFFAAVSIMVYVRRKKIPFLRICDATAPGMMLAYGIARLGCHFAGDGDYGMPTNLPWAAVYSNGTYPPSYAFREFPEIVRKYGVNGVVPDTLPVHPTPVYEFLLAVAVFAVLWKLRKNEKVDGRLFVIYLLLSATSRFFVEFIRLNPRIMFGLSEAQLFALAVIAAALMGLRKLRGAPGRISSPPRPGLIPP